MQLVIPRETQPGENRVSATPETVKKLVRLGAEVVVETGAGVGAGPDSCVYAAGGSPDGQDALASAERWDLRTARWELLPPMARGRGYVAAAFDASGNFVVHGGYGETGDVGADARVDLEDGKAAVRPHLVVEVGDAAEVPEHCA